MSRAFGVTKESKSSSDYIANKKKTKCYQCRPVYRNEQTTNNLAVNLITKLDLAFIQIVNETGTIDPNGSLFGEKPCDKHNYLRYLVAR